MKFVCKVQQSSAVNSQCLVIDTRPGKKLSPELQDINDKSDGLISQLIKSKDITGDYAELVVLHQIAGVTAKRVLLVGAGSAPLGQLKLQKLLGLVSAKILALKVKDAAFALTSLALSDISNMELAKQISCSVIKQSYKFEDYKSKKTTLHLNNISLISNDKKHSKALKAGLTQGQGLGLGINTARQLGNLPGNVCTPTYLANQAKKLAKQHANLTCKVVDEKEMAKLGMGALLSVSQGSDEPAKLISLEYNAGKTNQKPYVFVGKGITFDTGGISLKAGAAMDEMKFDMCGAASVLGLMTAIVDLQLPINVVGMITSAENMPSGNASKPGDIVRTMSGQTVEILNTDAEGRLVLCDALTYAEKYQPKAVIDIATLTGACVIALGGPASGLFSNQQGLADQLSSAGNASGDKVWQLPIWDEYQDLLNSNFADMANIGGRTAGSITAACFLSRYTKKYDWAHIDIAATGWNSGNAKGATGRPVAMLLQYILDRC